MIGCEFCHAVISEPCRSPIAALDCKAASVSEHLAAARSTISEQEQKIAELEAENAHANGVAVGMAVALNQTKQALTSERQQRKEAETALRQEAFTFACGDAAKAYFLKYEPIPADREGERGG